MGIPERKERERLKRKKAILKSAKNVFSRRGFINATIEEIAQESELSTGTIYLYFSGKEELYVSTIVESHDMIIQKLRRVVRQDLPPGELLIDMADTYYKFCQEYPDHYRVMNFIVNEHLNLKLTPGLMDKIGDKTDALFKMVDEIVKHGVKLGVFKPVNTWDITRLFWSSLHGIIQVQTSMDYLKHRTTDIATLMRKNTELMVSAIKADGTAA